MRSLRPIKHRLLVEVRFLGVRRSKPTSRIERNCRSSETKRIAGIIHLAAILPTAARREPVRATEVNIQGSLNLLQLSRQFSVHRFVFGSSLSVYGTCPPDELVSETNRAAPEDLYGAAKSYVEQLGQSYQERHNLQFVSLRIGRVIGPGAQSSTSAWRSEIFECLAEQKAIEINLPYIGSERLLVVHEDDVARMLVALMDAPRPKFCIYNSVCEPVIVEDLKRQIEGINPRVLVRLGNESASGNPRLLDCSRFRGEFGFETRPVFDVLWEGANGRSASTAGGMTTPRDDATFLKVFAKFGEATQDQELLVWGCGI